MLLAPSELLFEIAISTCQGPESHPSACHFRLPPMAPDDAMALLPPAAPPVRQCGVVFRRNVSALWQGWDEIERGVVGMLMWQACVLEPHGARRQLIMVATVVPWDTPRCDRSLENGMQKMTRGSPHTHHCEEQPAWEGPHAFSPHVSNRLLDTFCRTANDR